MNRQLSEPLGHDSVWSFITGADDVQLRRIGHRTDYKLLSLVTAGASGGLSAYSALYLPLVIRSDEELAEEHERIAAIVYEIVQQPWKVETLFFKAGSVIATYQRLEWWSADSV